MGRDIGEVRFTREDRHRYREKLRRNLAALGELLAAERFETGRDVAGVEVEFYVLDDAYEPTMLNAELLSRLESHDFQTELARFNIEFNLAPHPLTGHVFGEIEQELASSFRHADRGARELGACVAMIGIIPTLRDLHVTFQNLSANPRYHLLNEQILAARGEDVHLDITGTETLSLDTSSIAMEAAATSMQLHLQVEPRGFGAAWNASQAASAPLVCLGANSPFLLGRELWRETRIALFEQAIDTRSQELSAQGVRPRVWFGERWVDGVMDLFEENLRYYPALLPMLDEEDPEAVLAAGGIPRLPELTLHNGTVWRWNRPIYGIARGEPHLRVECRVLPAGPTVVDMVANAAFHFGLVRGLLDRDPPIDAELEFRTAADNFVSAARDGLGARLVWPGRGELPAVDLVLDTLLPLADEGLVRLGVDAHDRDSYLGVIERRARTGLNGAEWQVRTFRHLQARGRDRADALRELTRRYLEGMRSDQPVHTWPVPGRSDASP